MTQPKNPVTHGYIEFGIGNPTLISSEIEYPDGSEERFPGIIRMRVISVYWRLWVNHNRYSWSTRAGFQHKLKPRKAFKLLLGLMGEASPGLTDPSTLR